MSLDKMKKKKNPKDSTFLTFFLTITLQTIDVHIILTIL